MKLIQYLCDRCSEEIGEDERFEIIILKRNKVDSAIQETPYPELSDADFCQKCIEEIAAMVMNEEKPIPVEDVSQSGGESLVGKPQSSGVVGKRGRNRVDKGRIMALYNAGWKPKDIAGDCHCSEASVYVVIKKSKEGNR